MNLFEQIREIVSDQLGLSPEGIKPESSFIDDLGADSIDTLELVMGFEEVFGIEIIDKDAEKLQTISDVIKYIESRTNQTSIFEDGRNRSRS